MLPEQTIHIVAFQQNIGTLRHKLGRPEAKMGDEYDFSVYELTDGCNLPVKVICDYCGKEFIVPLSQRNYRLKSSPAHKDCCGDYSCRVRKKRDTSLIRFGVESPQSLPQVKEKVSDTCIQKYGTASATQAQEVKSKIKETLVRNYGEDYAKAIRDVYSPTADSLEEQICDYIAPGQVIPVSPPTAEKLPCEIKGSAKLLLGRTRTYQAIFYDADGNDVSANVTADWNYPTVSGITCQIDGNCIKVSAAPLDELIGAELILMVTADGYDSAKLTVEVGNIV